VNRGQVSLGVLVPPRFSNENAVKVFTGTPAHHDTTGMGMDFLRCMDREADEIENHFAHAKPSAPLPASTSFTPQSLI